ncbi:MAG TPA: CinA family nicotinamide mononucleotide deamidase-related protein [Planctomycetota bacterium]|nr:CinA family nicotinamide mononucleotide deamidase-related protein [Planctomycetota bacterium]
MSAPRLVAILAVGDELLAGELLDSNSAWLARQVRARGHAVTGFAVVGDELPAIRAAVQAALAQADLLLVTGGLGPTGDDITRDGVAAALGVPLAERPELVARLQKFYAERSIPLGAGSRRQAEIPVGATVLDNPVGTAAGFLHSRDGRAVACFPGVPSELHVMAPPCLDACLPPAPTGLTRQLHLCGLAESELGEKLADLMDHVRAARREARLGVTARLGVLTIALRGTDAAAVAAMEADVRSRVGELLFGEADETLARAVVRHLARRRETLTTAESCTGGLLAGAITSAPGSSEVFREGVVVYSNAAKTARLGVPEALLAEHGAVSEPVALAMARGARERARADHALAITGIAGPGGGTPEKPAGTVCLAVAGPDGERALTRRWTGTREEVRGRSVNLALELLRRRIAAP